MVSDIKALDAMSRIVQKWRKEGGSISTAELAELAGDDYTVHSDTNSKHRPLALKHKFGRVIETGGHLWVAVGVNGDRWVMDDTDGQVIVEVYNRLKAEMDAKREKRERSKGKKRIKWTAETVLEEARKYESSKQFRIQSGSAYQKALKLGIIDQLVFAE